MNARMEAKIKLAARLNRFFVEKCRIIAIYLINYYAN